MNTSSSAKRGIEAIAVMVAGNAFVSVPALPGYDAKDEQAPALPFDNTTLMNTSGASQRPRAGGNTGQEPGPANL